MFILELIIVVLWSLAVFACTPWGAKLSWWLFEKQIKLENRLNHQDS